MITLAIIGIIAALTIPTLVQNYQTRAWNTADKVFQRKLEEALKVMNTQQTLAGYRDTESFVNELAKHFKITKICKNDDITSCFSDIVYWGKENEEIEEVEMADIKTSESFGQEEWDTKTVGVQFANGVNAVIAYNPECKQDPYSNRITGSDCLAILYDTSGFKAPNTVNKDLRNNQNVLSLAGVKGGFCLPDGTCFTSPFEPDAHIWNACDSKGETTDSDDLAFMKKYGIKKCMNSSTYGKSDYWAGAVEACGGVNKMPTLDQLAKIANYVYKTSDINGKLTIDNDKVASLGFTQNASGYFYVWSGEEIGTNSVYAHIFGLTEMARDFTNRNHNFFQAVCLAD